MGRNNSPDYMEGACMVEFGNSNPVHNCQSSIDVEYYPFPWSYVCVVCSTPKCDSGCPSVV